MQPIETASNSGLLAGRVAVVTGASRGIGEYIAKRFAMEGAKVVVSARTQDAADHYLPGTINATAAAINTAGGEAIAVQADLALAADRENLIATAQSQLGPIDILVNNAAITYFIPIATFPQKRYDLMHEVQVWAPMHLTQLVLPGMRERGRGWILNVSSGAAQHPDKTADGRGSTVYGMCKAALERFTTGLAQELYDEHIGVNVISPGLVATPGVMHHKLINDSNRDRLTPVEHMAEACLHLVHGNAQTLTGRIDNADDVVKEFSLNPVEID
jgi:NAD(P)-dependent dehydrogenase (short-subunit alcohol dehydrogenase family)